MNKRSLEITAFGLPFSVTFESEHVRDPLGTGDSPNGHEIILLSVSVADSEHNILDMLDLTATGEITQQVANALADESRSK